MNKEIATILLIAVSIIVLGVNVPRLPSQRYDFGVVENESSYSNYQFSTLIYDNWTGEVKYVAEAKFDDDNKIYLDPKKEPQFVAVGTVLQEGQEPTYILTERYTMLGIIGLLVGLVIYYVFKIKNV